MTRARAGGLLALGTALMAAATPAAAAEGETLLLLDAGFAVARADARWRPGAVVGASGQYGLDDAWSLRAELSASWHPVGADTQRPGGHVRATALALGVTYTVDVLRVVPFVGGGLVLQNLAGAVDDARTDLGAELGGGADYLLDRRWSLGLALAYRICPLALASGRVRFGGTPQTASVALRLGRSW